MKNKFIKNLLYRQNGSASASRRRDGFTLVETLVAIAILSAAIAGPLVLSIKNIGTANTSQDQLVAFYLGQEVIEYVRNVRDTNLIGKDLNDVSFYWLEELDGCINKDCYIDVVKTGDNICEVSSCLNTKLNFDDNEKNYKYSSGNDGFTRTVKITNPVGVNADEAQVDITMTWKSRYGKKTKEMKLQDHIFNWRE